MTSTKYFSVEETDRDAVIVSPLETVRSFADDQVRDEWDEVFSMIDNSHARHLILDMGRLSFFGSTMLEWIVVLGKRMKSSGGMLVICNATGPTKEVLHIAKFDTLYPIRATREDALAELPPEESAE